jgi:sugar O-acyltransferase (sialic acid O-acetyltransferase NeuD family)
MARLALIGGGGFAKEVLELAELRGDVVAGYVADAEGVLDRPYWGQREMLLERRDAFDAVFIAFGFVNRRLLRARADMVDWVRTSGFATKAIVSPSAVIAKGAVIEQGAFVAHGAVISVDARISAFAIVNYGAIIGHDAQVGSNVILAPGAFIGGVTRIGDDCLIGPGANVLQGLSIGRDVIVGVGASVIRDVPNGSTVWGPRAEIVPDAASVQAAGSPHASG